MRWINGFQEVGSCRGGVVAIGNFDGVHLGHQSMLTRLVERARERDVPAVAMTFDPHPIQLLRPDSAPPQLTTTERKAELIARCGPDCLIVYPTDWGLLQLTPREFFDRVIVGALQASGLVEGANFHFGRDRAGDVRTLRALCGEAGLTLDVVSPVEVGGRTVSSSAIRDCIADGDVAGAACLLGAPYRIAGIVSQGAMRGRTIGFPTANLADVRTLLPRDGVYACRAESGGRVYPAAVNVGANPTFGESQRKVEAHLIGFHGDLYGQPLELEFVRRLRDTRPFVGVEELRRQLEEDVRAAREVACGPPAY